MIRQCSKRRWWELIRIIIGNGLTDIQVEEIDQLNWEACIHRVAHNSFRKGKTTETNSSWCEEYPWLAPSMIFSSWFGKILANSFASSSGIISSADPWTVSNLNNTDFDKLDKFCYIFLSLLMGKLEIKHTRKNNGTLKVSPSR